MLEFEARGVCQFSRSTASQFARNIIKVDDWENILQVIRDSETNCQIMTQIIDAEEQLNGREKIELILAQHMEKSSRDMSNLSDAIVDSTRSQTAEMHKLHEATISWRTDQESRECYETLRTSDYVFDNDKNPDRLAGTCEWFLQHEKYLNWRHREGAGWLWVTADPGCGKSVLSKFLVGDFEAQLQSENVVTS